MLTSTLDMKGEAPTNSHKVLDQNTKMDQAVSAPCSETRKTARDLLEYYKLARMPY